MPTGVGCRVDTPKTLRERAQHWRTLAGQQSYGTADALIEAACDLEIRAHRLEAIAPRSALASVTASEPSRRSWRLMPRRFRGAF